MDTTPSTVGLLPMELMPILKIQVSFSIMKDYIQFRSMLQMELLQMWKPKTITSVFYQASAVLPYWEGFEDYTSLENLTNWEIINLNNNNAFNLATGIGYTGNKCARLVNYGQQPSMLMN